MTEKYIEDPSNARLVDHLYTNYLVLWYSLFSLSALQDIPDRGDVTVGMSTGSKNFKTMFLDQYSDYEEHIRDIAIVTAARGYLKENFRLTKNYLDECGQLDRMQNRPWYQFTRILVNCLSHNMVFDFSTVNPNHLPARYNDYYITEDMDGTYPPLDFDAELYINLGDNIRYFVNVNPDLFDTKGKK